MAGETNPLTPMGGVKAFDCGNCGGQVKLLAPGQSLAAACSHCGAVTDLMDENLRIISRAHAQVDHQPLFEIGSKATFEGKSWVLIGFMVRIAQEWDFQWEEYLLFNPYYGFRFLANAGGHWSWIRMVQDMPLSQQTSYRINYRKQHFRKMIESTVQLRLVLGEFYWQAKVGDVASTVDYIAPPSMLSCELEDGGIIWSAGEYVEPAVVAAAFGVDRSILPKKVSVGANQPNPHKKNLKWILPVWLISLLATVIMGLVFVNRSPQALLLDVNYNYPLLEDTVSKEFIVGNGVQNIEVEVLVGNDFSNHWVELSGILHNITNNVNYEVLVPVEFYEGNDDGYWSEGSRNASMVLNEIPEGKYELVSSLMSDTTGIAKIKVWRGVPVFSNWIWILLFLSIIPVYLIIRSSTFEKKRNE